MLEAIALCETLTGRAMNWRYRDEPRTGDHIWWISDVRKFKSHYPEWSRQYDLRSLLGEIINELTEREHAPVRLDAH